MTQPASSKKGLLTGPLFCLSDNTSFSVADLEALSPFTEMRAQGDVESGWLLQIKGNSYRLTDAELELLIPGLMDEYEHVNRAKPNSDLSLVVTSWLQRHYLESWIAVPAVEQFSIWKLINRQNFNDHKSVDSESLAQLYPAMQLLIDLGSTLVEQKVAMDSYLRKPNAPPVEIPTDFNPNV